MPAPAASQVQYRFRGQAAADARIFNTARVRPRRMFQSQAHQQSGNRYNPGNTNHREWAELAIEGSLDVTDLLLHLAALAPYKTAGTGADIRWDFHAMAGAVPGGFTAPKVWHNLQAKNWAATGPDYIAGSPTLQNLEINFNAGGDSMITAAYLAQQYIDGAQTLGALTAVDPILPLNSDIRVGLSSGRLGDLQYPTAVLGSRMSYNNLIEPVFGANQADRGWTDTVEAMLAADLRIRFVAEDDYLDFDLLDDLVWVTLSDADNSWEIVHRASFRDVPNGPGAQQNLQEVELSFLPVARVDSRAAVSPVFTFTAAVGTGVDAHLTGVRTSGTAIGASLALQAGNGGYMPTGLDRILYDANADKLILGVADAAGTAWPENWEPATIQIGSGMVYDLEYVAASRTWQTVASITTSPISVGASTATVGWKWTPASFLSAFMTETQVPAFM